MALTAHRDGAPLGPEAQVAQELGEEMLGALDARDADLTFMVRWASELRRTPRPDVALRVSKAMTERVKRSRRSYEDDRFHLLELMEQHGAALDADVIETLRQRRLHRSFGVAT